MQLDLFSSIPTTLVNLPPNQALPKPLAKHPHGLQLGSHYVTYQLHRTKRRTIALAITHEGLTISAPRWVTLSTIHEAIVSKESWVLKKLREQQERAAAQPAASIILEDGASLCYLGQIVTLRRQYECASYFDGSTKTIALNMPMTVTSAQYPHHVHQWLKAQAQCLFEERLGHLAQIVGVDYHSFALSNAKTMWGSCCPKGKIRLNWRLIHLQPYLIDYVITHELAHRREFNHSARFWAIVKSVCPDYMAARRELRRWDLKAL